MNALFKLLVLAGPVAVAGCAATSAHVPPPPAEHPASPQAAAAAVPERSTTLVLEPRDAPAVHEHAESAHAAAATSQPIAAYTCPHHPEVTQATPGTCPKCKMKLRPAEPADAKGPSDHSGHGAHEGHGAGHEEHGGHTK
jgi:hypothetical protein